MNYLLRHIIVVCVLFVALGQLAQAQNNTYWSSYSNYTNTIEPSYNKVNLKIVEAGTEKQLSIKDDGLTVDIEVEQIQYQFEQYWMGSGMMLKNTGRERTYTYCFHNQDFISIHEATTQISVTVTRPGCKAYTTTVSPRFVKFGASREEVIRIPCEPRLS